MKAPVKKIAPITNTVAKTKRSPMLAISNDFPVGNIDINR
jgi:hypothetical protein